MRLLDRLVAEGLDVARINLSHGSRDEHLRTAAAIREAESASGRPVGILVDLPGPKLRLGELLDDPLDLDTDASIRLTGPAVNPSRTSLPLTDGTVAGRLREGDRILLADGAAELRITHKGADAAEAVVVHGGPVRSGQGVSVPADRLATDALGTADQPYIPQLLEITPDFVGQSFVRSASDVERLRSGLPEGIRIIAKIETQAAVDGVDDILAVADGIMVARGDLGVEMPFERVPLVQKDLVRAALAAGKPSIVATQMLESMVSSPRPTRAEAGDVANAIIDGADAVMLSAETAIGEYPTEALRTAAAIAAATDEHQPSTRPPRGMPSFGPDLDARALAVAAVAMADHDPDVVALACATSSGRTPQRLAALRPDVPIVAIAQTGACARSLTLRRGVISRIGTISTGDPGAIMEAVADALRATTGQNLSADKAVVLVQTSPRGGTNALTLLRG